MAATAHVMTLRDGLMITALNREFGELRRLADMALERGTTHEKQVAAVALLLDDSADAGVLRWALAASLGWERVASLAEQDSIFSVA